MPATATREIDRVLSEVREQRRPGYLLLPPDVARFEEAPDRTLARHTGGTSPRARALFIEAATELIAGHQLTVLADLSVHRLNAVDKLEALLAADVVPHAALMSGEGLVDGRTKPSWASTPVRPAPNRCAGRLKRRRCW